ncbi:MAG: sugar phosphate isomerase/epimerase family protein [Clostridia bacterium]|nr:sugar phosphate isomerase/epimerase family protein [Clostridia bacterium]
MDNKIIMHINYCEQGQSLEETCEKAVAWGYDGVEFRSKRFGIEEDMNEYLETIYKAAKKHGLGYILFGGGNPDVINDDPKIRESSLEYCEKFYPRAKEMFGFGVCNLFLGSLLNPSKEIPYAEFEKHGSYIARPEHWKRAEKGLKQLAAIAKKNDFKFAMETHPNYMHDCIDATMKLVEISGSENIGVNLDYINSDAVPGGMGIEDALNAIGDRLYYMHLKNIIKMPGGRIRLGLGDGEYNNRHILKCLKDSGYKGPICVEAPRQGDREWFAQQDLAYIKSVIKDLG